MIPARAVIVAVSCRHVMPPPLWLDIGDCRAVDDRRTGRGADSRSADCNFAGFKTPAGTRCDETNGSSVVPIDRGGRQARVPRQLETALPSQIAIGARLLNPATQYVFAAREFGIGPLDGFSQHDAATSCGCAGPERALEDDDVASGDGARRRGREPGDSGADNHDVACGGSGGT